MWSAEIILTLAILVGTVVAFALEKWSVDLVALISLASLLVTGLITPDQGFQGFSNPATITIAALFVLSAGIQNSGILERLARLIEAQFSKNLKLALFKLMVLVGILSAFINNTAVVALFLPLVMSACRTNKISPSKALIPLSFASMFGGVCTLIGTSTNLLVSEISFQQTGQKFTMFEFTALGAILFASGILYMLTFGFRLLPAVREGQQLTVDFDMEDHLFQFVVRNNTVRGDKLSTDLQGSQTNVLNLRRREETDERLSPRAFLQSDDLVTVRSDKSRDQSSSLDPLEGVVTDNMVEGAESALVEVLVRPNSNLSEQSLKVSGVASTDIVPLAIRHKGRVLHSKLEEEKLYGGDTVLFSVGRKQLEELLRVPFSVVSAPSRPPLKSKITAILILVCFLLSATFGLLSTPVAAAVAAIAIVATGCLSMEQAYQSVEWRVIVLLAAMFGLGEAMTNSGTTAQLTQLLSSFCNEPATALAALYCATVGLTTFMSNGATAILLAPLGGALAEEFGVSGLPFMVAVAMGASSCFLSPIGYQTNLMVYGPGHYNFRDFFLIGLPLNIIFAIVTLIVIPILWPFGAT